MEQKKNSNLGFSLIGGGCISFLVFLFSTSCMAVVFYLMAISGGAIGESVVSLIILASPICGGVFGIISLIATPIILSRLNIPREITTPAMKGALGIGAATFVLFWIFGAVGTHIYNLNQPGDFILGDIIKADIFAGVFCGLPMGMLAALIWFLIIYFRRSKQKPKETQPNSI